MRAISVLLAWFLALAPGQNALAQEPALLLATGANQPHMAIDAEGNIYIACIHQGNIAVLTSTDRGRSFGQPVVAIDAKGKAHGHKQRGPRIGVDAKKRLTVTCPVVLDAGEFSKKYPTQELVMVSSADGGRTWTNPVQINEVAKEAPEALHWMAVAPTGEVHIAWLDMRSRKGGGQDIYYAKVVDGKVGKNYQIASTVCECCAPGMALDNAGNPVVVYREGGKKPSREIFAVSSKDMGTSFGKPEQVNQTPTRESSCPMSAPAMVISGGQVLTVAWKDLRTGLPSLNLVLASAAGQRKEVPVHRQAEGRQDHPSMTLERTGALWMAWEEKTGDEQRVYVMSAAGDESRSLSEASEGQAAFPVLASNGGLVAVTYEAKKDNKLSSYFRLLKQ